jgi:transposase
MRINELFELYRRWREGHSARSLARNYGFDRKTVEKYCHRFAEIDVPPDASAEVIREYLNRILPENLKPAPAFAALIPFEQELRELLERKENPLKPKSAWLVLAEKYDLAGHASYETFKRFVRQRGILVSGKPATVRIELPPGEELQIDYGFVGYHTDPLNGLKRKVHAFCGILSFSRFPFLHFVYSQDQTSFTLSHVRMFSFYGGAPKKISLDNLKTGILKAHVTDPTVNTAYGELCEYYGVFVDPCRVARPEEKGKIERFIPQARELFRRLVSLHPEASLEELSDRALIRCTDEYGGKPHGTTGIPPARAFDMEKPSLLPLPARPFEVPFWTIAKVHPDQFIMVKKKMYSLPRVYVGKRVTVRISGGLVRIFFQEKEIRRYTVPSGHRAYREEDFPESSRAFMNGTYPDFLKRSTRENFGDAAADFIELVLKPNAMSSPMIKCRNSPI